MDLVIRATIVFFFILLVTRIAGRRELSDFEPFDFILLVVVGDLVQQGITQNDQSVTGTLIVLSTVALLSVFVGWSSFRFRPVRKLTEGEPIVLVQNGRPIERNLRRERMCLEEVEEDMRKAQIATLKDVAWGILEDDGQISWIPRKS